MRAHVDIRPFSTPPILPDWRTGYREHPGGGNACGMEQQRGKRIFGLKKDGWVSTARHPAIACPVGCGRIPRQLGRHATSPSARANGEAGHARNGTLAEHGSPSTIAHVPALGTNPAFSTFRTISISSMQ